MNLQSKKNNISADIGGLMQLINPFTKVSRNFNAIDFIRDAIKNKKFTQETFHYDYRTIYKNHQFASIIKKHHVPVGNPTFTNSLLVLL